ncbi:MAG: rod shape-determining protein [Tissierellia bacterium]|nr:rod shape-determining protein [Tissierellia bacterium]
MASIRRNIAIDLGTASVLVYNRHKGVVLEEPSVIAIDIISKKILAVGKEAKKLLGRTPGNIVAIRPMRDGVIADFKATEEMLKYFINKSVEKALLKPDVLVCIPSKATQVEKRAVLQAAENAGSHRTYLIEEPLAAAIGAGVDISDAGGNMVVDIGGGTTDVAVVSMGQIVVSESIEVAGDTFDKEIIDFIRERYGLLIGERSAENIKIAANSLEIGDSLEIKGRDIEEGLPIKKYMPMEELKEALLPVIDEICDVVIKVLEETPPELAADLYDRGIILTGGASLTRFLRERLNEKIQVDVFIAENPVQCVVKGTGKALTWIDSLDEERNESIREKQLQLEQKERLRRR